MRIGFIGLGKLGMPVAETFAGCMHQVAGYDVEPRTSDVVRICPSISGAVDDAQVVFVAVQTPHEEAYGGHVPAPGERRGFDTSYLCEAVRQVVAALRGRPVPIAIVSTVLPGTCRGELAPLLEGQPLVYNPAFVAMGTVAHDVMHPEFVLTGGTDGPAMAAVGGVYSDVAPAAPQVYMPWESAELTKVAYNTAISMKIVMANALAEMAEAVGADVDDVTDVLSRATDRIVSSRYTRAGMGDGGPCHPRDNIAMSWLAQQVGLSADPFDFVTRAREQQTYALARRVAMLSRDRELPVHLLGWTYKPGVPLTDGSPARLLGYYLERLGVDYDWSDGDLGHLTPVDGPRLFVVSKCDPAYAGLPWVMGSVVIDPCGVVGPSECITLIRPGRNPR